MRLTPLDIRKQEFTRGFRGYEPDEVNAFLQMVSTQWDEILDESRRKDEKIRELENKMAHYEKVEEALQEALQTARDTSRKALENAEDKARLIVEAAERRADDIKRDAEQDRHQIKRDTAKLSGRRSEIVSRLRAFLMSEMELLARFEGDDAVGFIKLLPAEEQPVQQPPAKIRESGSRADLESRSVDSHETEPTTTFASTSSSVHDQAAFEEGRPTSPPEEPHADDQFDESRGHDQPHESRGHDLPDQSEPPQPSQGHASRETTDQTPEQAPTEASDRTPARSNEEVMHGPGWRARTVISRPSEQSSSRPEHSAEFEEEEGPEETPKRTSSDEIEKIRRILSDLD